LDDLKSHDLQEVVTLQLMEGAKAVTQETYELDYNISIQKQYLD